MNPIGNARGGSTNGGGARSKGDVEVGAELHGTEQPPKPETEANDSGQKQIGEGDDESISEGEGSLPGLEADSSDEEER